MRTRFAIPLFVFLCLPIVLSAALPPIQRNPWTTNTPAAWNAAGSNITFWGSDAYNIPFEVFSTNGFISTFLVNSNGTVGINTNIPRANFHVVGTTLIDGPFTNTTGNAAFLGGTAYFEDGINVVLPSIMNGLTATNLRVHQSDAFNIPFIVYTGNVFTALMVTSNGLVGIRTNNPLAACEINTGAATYGFRIFGNFPSIYQIVDRPVGGLTADMNNVSVRNTGSGITVPAATIGVFGNAGATYPTVDYIFFGCGSNIAYNANTFRIYSNTVAAFQGNLGIGTNTPQQRLHVVNLTANADTSIDIANDAQTWRLQTYGTDNDDFRIVDVTDSTTMALGIIKDSQTVYVRALTNAVAPPTFVKQPIGVFSQLAYERTNTLDMVYETYTNIIVNAFYDNVITNGFYASTNAGTLTNIYAGFYEVNYSLSVLGDANVNGDEIEVEVFFDGVGDEHTSAHVTVNATSGFFSLAKTHIKYLPALTRIELKARNIADVDQDFDITRIVFIAKSP